MAAMGVAIWQATEARRSRQIAKEGAEAAKAQAAAATAQVAIMRADRDDRTAPKFVVKDASDCGTELGTFAARITLELASGPSLSSVVVTTRGSYIGDPDPSTFQDVRRGGSVTFVVLCNKGYVESQGSADLACVEDGGEGRRWTVGVGFVIRPGPPGAVGGVAVTSDHDG